MVKRTVTVRREAGLEARPIAMLVQKASQFSSRVYIEVGTKSINAKSIMGIMAFNPSEGMSVSIVTEGSDEQEALLAIERFLVCE
jgi:phosphotransferase system HPr (HPr) family protein